MARKIVTAGCRGKIHIESAKWFQSAHAGVLCVLCRGVYCNTNSRLLFPRCYSEMFALLLGITSLATVPRIPVRISSSEGGILAQHVASSPEELRWHHAVAAWRAPRARAARWLSPPLYASCTVRY